MSTNAIAPEIDSGKTGVQYTEHTEPAAQGGMSYVRCECCGREVIGTDPNRLQHRDDCVYA